MTQSPHAVMLFAAGFGTRMGALTKNLPKPLVSVHGKPLIDHTLDLVWAIHPDKLVANTHYLGDQIADHLKPLGVTVTREHPDILDTGGGLKAALPLLGGGPVFTMNTDAIWVGQNPLALLKESWQPDRMDGLLMCVPIGQTHGHPGQGDFDVDELGHVQRGSETVYGGVQIVKTDLLANIDQTAFSLNLLWDQMLKQKRLFALVYTGEWCDVGHPAAIDIAESVLQASHV